ncbi:MAG: restriction endonuclease [Syntrophales bacterium]|nr:restriction endonuclease [Syntrophales bacterium]
MPQHQVQLPQRARKFTVTHEPITIGDWAGYLHMRSKTLIATFSRAGVRGLTPNHLLDPAHAKALLAYLQAEQQSRTTEVYADQGPLDSKIIIVQSLSTQLLEELAKRPKLMYQLEPRKFEELVAKLLEDQGCDVTLTKRTRDGGYDLFGSMKTGPTEVVFLAECKRYSPENKVGVELVRNLYGVTEIHKANLGLLITSSTFTPDAQQEKIRIGPRISLKDYEDLKIWLARYQPKGPGILLS